ncbi:methyltransferase family protein [Planctomycetota bacterium]
MSNIVEQNGHLSKLNYFGFKSIVRDVSGALFFLSLSLNFAGSLEWINAWGYAIYSVLFHVCGGALLAKANPQMLNERGKLIQKNTQPLDKVWVASYIFLVALASCVAGLDAVLFEWSHMPFEIIISAAIIHIIASLLWFWAMAVNPHFETTVRIQEERNHRVCTSGPYKYVRHPGYVSLSAMTMSYSFILGSWWGNLPMGMVLILLVIRTSLEDKFLQKELKGYKEYAQETKYRLVPYVW